MSEKSPWLRVELRNSSGRARDRRFAAGLSLNLRQRSGWHSARRPRRAGHQPGPGDGVGAGAPHQGRQDKPQRLPLLLGRLRHACPHDRRQHREYRGGLAQPSQRGDALSKGRRHLPAPYQPQSPHQALASCLRSHGVGGVEPGTGHGPRRRASQKDAGRDLHRTPAGLQAGQRDAGHLFAGWSDPGQ
jgi:hypothetical protein